MLPSEWPFSEIAQSLPRIAVLFERFEDRLAVQVWTHFRNAAPPRGIETIPVFRVTPAGNVPIITMSVGMVSVDWMPVPAFHSPKAIVFVDPSVMSRSPIDAPRYWNTPLGGPAVCPASYSSDEPVEAK